MAALAARPRRALSDNACPTCGRARPGRFCASCGERRIEPGEFGIGHFLRSLVGGLTDLNGRVLGTFRILLTRPGLLTSEWARGSRVPYLRPVQLFLLVTVLVILLSVAFEIPSWLLTDGATGMEWNRAIMAEQAARLGLDDAAYRALYEAKNAGLAKATVFVILPVAAAISALLHRRSEPRAGVHLAFACSFVSYYLLVPDLLFRLLAAWPHQWLGQRGGTLADAGGISLFLVPLVLAGAWWARAERRAFGKHGRAARWRAWVAAPLFLISAKLLHQTLVFLITIRRIEG